MVDSIIIWWEAKLDGLTEWLAPWVIEMLKIKQNDWGDKNSNYLGFLFQKKTDKNILQIPQGYSGLFTNYIVLFRTFPDPRPLRSCIWLNPYPPPQWRNLWGDKWEYDKSLFFKPLPYFGAYFLVRGYFLCLLGCWFDSQHLVSLIWDLYCTM